VEEDIASIYSNNKRSKPEGVAAAGRSRNDSDLRVSTHASTIPEID
jgi:hypothetical protein